MKFLDKYPFTVESLLKLGITEPILRYRFEEWLSDPNYRVDFEKRVLYAGVSKVYKEIADRSELLIKGGRRRDLEALKDEIQDTRVRINELTEHLTEDQKKEFYLRMMEESMKEAEETESQLFDELLAMAKDPDYVPGLDSEEPQQKIIKNPFPKIFVGVDNANYELFRSFVDNHIIDPYLDFSFIFGQMKKENKLHRIYSADFMSWLRERDFISSSVFDNFMSKGQFSSIGKTANGHRLNNYFNLKTELGIR